MVNTVETGLDRLRAKDVSGQTTKVTDGLSYHGKPQHRKTEKKVFRSTSAHRTVRTKA